MQAAYISINDIVALTGLGRTTIYRRVKDGTFPKPMKIGCRTLWNRETFLNALSDIEANQV